MEKDLYHKSLDFLARRAHSRVQLRRKLLLKGSVPAVEEILDQLESKGLLNDQELALSRALAKRTLRCWGDLRISRDLDRLGIDATIVQHVLEQVNREKGESESLREAIQSWIAKCGAPTTPAHLKKLYDHCLRLGYPGDQIRSRLEPLFDGIDWSRKK